MRYLQGHAGKPRPLPRPGVIESEPVLWIPTVEGEWFAVDADRADLAKFKWCLRTGYPSRRLPSGYDKRIHRDILPVGFQFIVDHKNGNRLDCRHSNLRPATVAENQQNRRKVKGCSTSYKGVYRVPGRNKPFNAYIRVDGIRRSLGYYLVAEDAARAYDKAASAAFGEFAWLNFP